ncbi:MAG: hypothetical protein AAGG69_13690, partial [Pseudomonadota bacterium]
MVALVAIAIVFSFALACGMPFAAIGALAALTLAPRNAFVLAGLAWAANQVIGFGFLGYPFDLTTLAWGVALGVSAFAAVVAAMIGIQKSANASPLVNISLAFLAAWTAQQAVVFGAGLILGGTASAFAPAVVWFIFWTNALAFIVLFAAQLIGARVGVAKPPLPQALG